MSEKNKLPANPRDFGKMDEKQVLARVCEDFTKSKQFQQPFFDKFVEYYKLYRSYLDDSQKRPNRSNLFIPYTFHLIETITPKIISSIFATRPFVQAIPLGVDNQTRELRAKKMSKFLDYQFNQRIKIVPILTDVMKTALIYGTAVTKQTWNFKTKRVIQKKPVKALGIVPTGTYEEIEAEVVVKDDPMVQNIPLTDFFFDPSATTIEDCRYCIHRYYEDYHELLDKQKKGVYKNVEKLKNSDSFDFEGSEYDMLSEIGLSSTTNRRKGIEIWEYWTDDYKVVVANGEVVLYVGENPYYHREKPFTRWVDNPVPNEFYGIGEAETIRDLQYELNTTRNQRIDNVSLIINRMFKVLRGANIDPKQLVSRPNGIIEVDSMDDVQELELKDVTSSAYNEEIIIKQDMDMATGVYDSARGSSPDRRETATTMSILSQAGTERFKLKTMLMEYGGIQEMVNQIVRLNQQFIDRDKEVQILGSDGKIEVMEVTQDEILGEYDIIALGSSVEPIVNKEIRQNQLIQLLNVIAGDPNVNQQEFLKRLFEAFDLKNVEGLLNVGEQSPEQQLPPEMLQQLMGGGAQGEVQGQPY